MEHSETSCHDEHIELKNDLNGLAGKVEDHISQEHQIVRGAVEEVMDRHEMERHHPSILELAKELGRNPTELIESFINTVDTTRLVVDALEGPSDQHLDGTAYRKTEQGLVYKINDMQEQLQNGVKHQWKPTIGQYTMMAGLLTALGTIAAALLAGS